jgi:hypothetical protein
LPVLKAYVDARIVAQPGVDPVPLHRLVANAPHGCTGKLSHSRSPMRTFSPSRQRAYW